MRYPILLALVAGLLAGCAATPSPHAGAYAATYASPQTITRTTPYSAVEPGMPAGGPVELIGVKVPFIGTGLTLQGGLVWDGSSGGVVTIPVGQSAVVEQSADPCAEPAGRWVTETRRVWVTD